jgi:TRAP-type C4-dicarboxylate transport system permease small subunit
MKTRGDALTAVIEEVMGWTLALMAVLVFGNVVLRYGFNSGIAVSEELSRYLFVWVTFIGAVAGVQRRQHLGIDSLTQRLSKNGRTAASVLAHLIMLLCCAILLWGSLVQMRVNQGNRSPVMEIPLSTLYAASAFGAAAMGMILLISFYRLVTGKATADELRLSTDETEQAAHEAEMAISTVGIDSPRSAEVRK